MDAEDKLIIAGVVLVAGWYLFDQLKNPGKVNRDTAFTLTQKAAEARGVDSWFAPMQDKQAIISGDPATQNTTTYFIDEKDYNSMTRWQRLLYSWNVPLDWVFG